MSVCGQSGQTEEDSASEEAGTPAVRDIYKQKPASKVVRVLTVLAYLLSVSLAAILLSVYYTCVWKSPELPLHNRTDHGPHYNAHTSHTSGGSDTAVSGDAIVHSPSDNITSASVTTEATTDVTIEDLSALPDTTPELFNGTEILSAYNDTDSIT